METIPNPIVGKIVESVTHDYPEEQSVNYNMHAGNKDIEISKKVKHSIGEKILLHEVRLFGSRARGEASADSDLDLYLETGPISREQRRIISDLVWEIGFENDIVISPLVIPQSEARNGAFSVSMLCKAIKTEGISI